MGCFKINMTAMLIIEGGGGGCKLDKDGYDDSDVFIILFSFVSDFSQVMVMGCFSLTRGKWKNL